MRLFVTGGSGFIGSAVVPELLGAGHEVVGLARSDASASALEEAGAEVLRGTLEDLDVLRAGAKDSEGVIHLAFVHDFGDFIAALATDRRAVDTMGEALAGSDRPLVIASGTLGLPPGRVVTEADEPVAANPRAETARAALDLAGHGVRSVVVRLSPSVHGVGDHGFVPRYIDIARERGVVGVPGDGSTHWSAVHVLDAARLFRLATESAPAGSVLHGVGDRGVLQRDLAETVGRHLGLPVQPVGTDRLAEHFGWLGPFLAMDVQASHALTTDLLGWEPGEPGLLEDLDQGHYFDLTTRMGGGSTA